MKAKDRHKANLTEYLSDPEKKFPIRDYYSKILGVTRKTVYQNFTPHELSEIEQDALENRKKATSRQRWNILNALYSRATGYTHPDIHISSYEGIITKTKILKHYPPDKAAAQEYFDRTEGKVLDKHEITGKDGKELQPIINVTTTRNKPTSP